MKENKTQELLEFYPTPKHLIDKMLSCIKWEEVSTILEPSAGKGDILKEIEDRYERRCYSRNINIDAVELNPELRHILTGNNFRVVHDDFLTFQTYKQYDLIVMNPPFSNGDEHLLKALEMQERGGGIICILNAETLKNPYTNRRKDLVNQLEKYNASIEYLEDEFTNAERTTPVEIALIKIFIPKKIETSFIFEEMKRKVYAEHTETVITDVADSDIVKAIVAQYDVEVAAGIKLIREYNAMKPYILDSVKESKYANPILHLQIGQYSGSKDATINNYVKMVRRKYWTALFKNEKFTKGMTQNQLSEYCSKVDELSEYDFSMYNIKEIQLQMSQNLVRGIEECIIELFDELTAKHSWYPECENNIHYYNGWCSNKAWIINKKVIIPLSAYNSIWKELRLNDYRVVQKLSDIEKALDYLNGGIKQDSDINQKLAWAEQCGQTKKIPLKYFTVTFYKKGTCHIEFTNLELLKKLNIFGSQQKGWLPPSYGKKAYSDMEKEEQSVIDEFEGKKSYDTVFNNQNYYIYNPNQQFQLMNFEERNAS